MKCDAAMTWFTNSRKILSINLLFRLFTKMMTACLIFSLSIHHVLTIETISEHIMHCWNQCIHCCLHSHDFDDQAVKWVNHVEHDHYQNQYQNQSLHLAVHQLLADSHVMLCCISENMISVLILILFLTSLCCLAL